MLEVIAAITAFVAVACLAAAIFSRSPHARAVENRLAFLQKPEGENDDMSVLKRASNSSLPGLRSLAGNSKWADRAALDLVRAGLNLRVSEYLLLRLLTAFLPAALMFVVTKGSPVGFVFALVLGFAGFMAPAIYVSIRKSGRLNALNGQLVEMLQLIANSLRSGFAFTQAIELATKQLTPPVSDELNHLIRDIALGARMEDALKDLGRRTGSLDIEMMVTSILVQRTAGGNLSEILDNVAATIRERERLKGEIKALTAQQRFTGLILSVYPIFLGVIFFLLAPELMDNLWETEIGVVLLTIAGTLQVLGMVTIRRILQLDV